MLREILQVLRSEYAFALFTASFAVLAAVIAFAIVGYLGLAILGILTLLICATMEIGKDGPLGSINTPDLHAWDAQHREAMTPAERAEHRSEVSVLLRSLYLVRLIGVAFVIAGFGGFYLFQLRCSLSRSRTRARDRNDEGQAGLRDIDEEEVSTFMVHETPEQY